MVENAPPQFSGHLRQPDVFGAVLLQIAVDVGPQPVALQDGQFAHYDIIDQHFEQAEHVFELFD